MKANNLTDKNIYQQPVKLNRNPVNTTILTNAELNQTGELIFEMCGKPNKKWGVTQVYIGNYKQKATDCQWPL